MGALDANKQENGLMGVVVKLDRGFPLVRLENGQEVRCEHATALVKTKPNRAVVGDRVRVALPADHDKGIIEATLPRTTKFVRKDPTERAVAQTLAANFDMVLVVQSADDIQPRRLERELVLAHETGAEVAVVVSKADLVSGSHASTVLQQVQQVAGLDRVYVVSAKDPESVQPLIDCLAQGNRTAILIGRSGVGKSTLVNLLVGHGRQATTPVRSSDGKGRHTTVSRELIALPSGGAIVDMPGVRGLGLWDAEEGLEAAFSDIEVCAQHCRFRDCSHTTEPGCAVRSAVEDGLVSVERLESYLRLRRENEEVRERKEVASRIQSRRGHPRRRQHL